MTDQTIPDDYLTFEKDDFKRGLLVENVGWHPVEITFYEKKRTKDGAADLHVYRFKGLDDDAGRKGVFLRWNVSSRAPKSIHAQIVAALDPTASKQPDYVYNPNNAVGKKIEAWIKIEPMDKDDPDSLTNSITNFRPLQS